MSKTNAKGFISIEIFATIVMVFTVGAVLLLVISQPKSAKTPTTSALDVSSEKSTARPKSTSTSTSTTKSTAFGSSTTKAPTTSKSTSQTSSSTSSSGSSGGSSGTITSYQTIATQFVSAMGDGGKTTVDSLETTGFQDAMSNVPGGNGSYYDYCQSQGSLCTPMYVPANVTSAQISTGVYTPTSTESTGHYVEYSEKTSSMSAVFDVDLVPSGNSWLVDFVNQKSISVK